MDISMTIGLSGLLVALVSAYFAYRGLLGGNWLITQENFRSVRRYIKENQKALIQKSFSLYKKNGDEIENVPLLINKDWMPDTPIELEKIELEFYEGETKEDHKELLHQLTKLWPYESSGKKFKYYTEAIVKLDPPKFLENRPSYRLMDIKKVDDAFRMQFSMAHYFDNFNYGESFGYEFASCDLKVSEGNKRNIRNRKFIRNKIMPFDLKGRYVNPGIVTLTIRKSSGGSSFYLQLRSNNVAISGQQYSLIPAGEFQPSTASPHNVEYDLDIWKNIMREYNEEFLGAEEIFENTGYTIDYDVEEPYRSLNEARRTGKVKAYYLGTTIQPFVLRGEILTVCVFESEFFDEFFKDLKEQTIEGKLIKSRKGCMEGLPFEEHTINNLEKTCDVVPSSLGCLKLCWEYREELGLTQ